MDEALWCKEEWNCGMGKLLKLCEKNAGTGKYFSVKWKMKEIYRKIMNSWIKKLIIKLLMR